MNKGSHAKSRGVWLTTLLAAAWLGSSHAGPYRFTLDGEPITPEITAVFGEEGAPAPGDVVKIGDFLMVLGDSGDHAFRSDGKDRMLGTLPGMDAEVCVAVKIRKTLGENDEWITIDPLSPMTSAEKAQLRGVFIDDRPDDLDGALAGVRWEHTVLTVNYGIRAEENREALPPLPPDLRYLDFELTMTPSLRDVRSLEPLRKLAYLSLDSRIELDLGRLTCGPELRFFDIGGATLTHIEAIAGWTAIRNLSLRWCDALSDIGFLKGLGELRRLDLTWDKNLKDIGPVATLPNLTWLSVCSWNVTDLSPVAGLTQLTHLYLGGSQVTDLSPVAGLTSLTHLGLSDTKVTDLSPIGRLPNLQMLDADNSAADTLPSKPVMPNLERATLLMTPLSAKAVATFQAALPACKVHHTLEGALLAEVAGADRLRARTGGTCHRRVEQEKTIFEIKGTEQVREFLENIRLVEPEGVGACMCCGDPTFEIYRGEELISMLGFHHATSLRWSGDDGWWPGDIELTDSSAGYLCQLLARHGYAGPLAEHEKRMRWKAQYEKHRAACLQFITAEQFDGWLEAFRQGEEVDLTELVRKALPDAEKRAATIYALYGALPEDPWHRTNYFDRVTDELLETVDSDALKTILARDDCPEQILQGVTRRIFGRWNFKVAKALSTPLFEKLANWALRHPSEYNRRKTVDQLAAMKTERANRIIVRFLHDSPQPRVADGPEETKPEDKPFKYRDPNDYLLDPFATEPADPPPTPVATAFVPPDGIGEPVAAALLLAQHGYPGALTEIRKLAAKTEGDERKILEKAVAILAEAPKK